MKPCPPDCAESCCADLPLLNGPDKPCECGDPGCGMSVWLDERQRRFLSG